MTFVKYFATSSLKCDLLRAKDGASISGTVTAHFDKNDISNTDISSTNDYQSTLSSSSGSSFLLEGSIIVDNTDANPASIILQFYDETNTSFIGTKCYITNKIDPEDLDPQYASTAACVILASDFGGSDITVSLRAVSTTGSATYPASLTFSNGRLLQPVLKVLQT